MEESKAEGTDCEIGDAYVKHINVMKFFSALGSLNLS